MCWRLGGKSFSSGSTKNTDKTFDNSLGFVQKLQKEKKTFSLNLYYDRFSWKQINRLFTDGYFKFFSFGFLFMWVLCKFRYFLGFWYFLNWLKYSVLLQSCMVPVRVIDPWSAYHHIIRKDKENINFSNEFSFCQKYLPTKISP